MLYLKSYWRWVIAGGYLLSLPFMRRVWELIRSFNVTLAGAMPLVMGALLLLFLTVYLIPIKREKRPLVYISLLLICIAYIYVSLSLPNRIERVHLAQYGFLSILVFWAMAGRGGGAILCLWSVVVTVEFGLADEFIQGLLPARIYDLNDVLLNGKAALLGQATVASVIRPWEGRPSTSGLQGERQGKRQREVLWLVLIMVFLIIVFDTYLIESGTPSVVEDVHREDGALRFRDGFLHFGRTVMVVNTLAITIAILSVLLTWGPTTRHRGYIKTAIICGLFSPTILLLGRLICIRFR